MRSLYDILEVEKNASSKEIEKKYKTLVKKYHPDLQPKEKKSYSEELLKKITEAYSVLGDEEKRKQYDEELENQNTKETNNNVEYDVNTSSYDENYIDKVIYKDIIENLDNYNLTDKEKICFKYYYFDDLSIKEIVDKMQSTESNIKYYLYSARNKIKEDYYD